MTAILTILFDLATIALLTIAILLFSKFALPKQFTAESSFHFAFAFYCIKEFYGIRIHQYYNKGKQD